jgi:hypothetical protein
MSTDHHVMLPFLAAPAVSPDGAWVAWTWVGLSPTAGVHVVPADGSAQPMALAHEPGGDTLFIGWAPDGGSALVQHLGCGAQPSRLSRVAPGRPGALEPLVELEPHELLEGAQLLPGGRSLVYSVRTEPEAPQGLTSRLCRFDAATGQRVTLVDGGGAHLGRPELHPDGDLLLYTRSDPHRAGRPIWMVDLDGEGDRELVSYGPSVKLSCSWVPDGRRFLVLLEAGLLRHLGIWDMRGGRLGWLLDDPRRRVHEAFVPRTASEAVVLEVKDVRVRVSMLDLDGSHERELPELPGCLVPLAPVEGEEWVGQYGAPQQPVDVVRFSMRELQPEAFRSLTRGPAASAGVRDTELRPAPVRVPVERRLLALAPRLLRWRVGAEGAF